MVHCMKTFIGNCAIHENRENALDIIYFIAYFDFTTSKLEICTLTKDTFCLLYIFNEWIYCKQKEITFFVMMTLIKALSLVHLSLTTSACKKLEFEEKFKT